MSDFTNRCAECGTVVGFWRFYCPDCWPPRLDKALLRVRKRDGGTK